MFMISAVFLKKGLVPYLSQNFQGNEIGLSDEWLVLNFVFWI